MTLNYAAELGSFMSAPQSPNQDDDDSDAEMNNGTNAVPYPPIVWPQASPPASASEAADVDVKTGLKAVGFLQLFC